VIPEIYVEQWRQNAPWSSMAMIEQDLILSRALVDLYRQPKISNSLAFRGGTALNKLFLNPAARYSEDIDFVQCRSEPIGEIIDAIRAALDSWLGEPKRKLTERSAKLIYRYHSLDGVPAKLKIEINTTEHFQVEPLQSMPFEVNSEWFSGSAFIKTYQLNELMGTKLRALYQRRKGRDLFDLWLALERKLIDPARVVSIFNHYGIHHGESVTRAMFEENLHFKKQNTDFQFDIIPLLSDPAAWSFSKAIEMIEANLIPKLDGEPWLGLANDLSRGFETNMPALTD
jgi:predicted nucleotidyltransferase component of viral defense system